MIDLIVLLIVNSLYCVGLWLATGEDMILERPAMWLSERVPEFWLKPVFGCPTCMASLHSILPFWLYSPFTVESVLLYIIYVPALATLNSLIAQRFDD